MAVFTPVSREHLIDFLEDYDLGILESFEGIEQGTQNTNYHVYTDRGDYVLTLFEGDVYEEDLHFVFSFIAHLNEQGIICPRALPDREGCIFGDLRTHKAALVPFIDGHNIDEASITDVHCGQLGSLVGAMHKSAETFKLSRPNVDSLGNIQVQATSLYDRADSLDGGMSSFIRDELSYLKEHLPVNLPSGVVHTDIFPDNVFFNDDELIGIIDFYFASNDFFAYDLAVAMNAWCFDTDYNFVKARWDVLIKSYEDIRPLTQEEKSAFQILCRLASLRFLILRLRMDERFEEEKNPREYVAKLRFHQNEKIFG